MKVYAPGKLILSGEHAVVHGQPALAMAVNRYAVASISRGLLSKVSLDLADLAYSGNLTLNDLVQVKERVKRKYQRFVNGEYQIRDVLRKPFELVQAALGIVAGANNITLPDGMKVHVTSNIPIGSGMGSSAAAILCVMKAASVHLNIPISTDILYEMALEAENLQHGNSSGLDLRVSLHGGCIYMQGLKVATRDVPGFTFYLVDTGKPETTTGECVKKVSPHFTTSSIGNSFAQVTNEMDAALQAKSWQGMHDAVKENHQLLCEIGVVPEHVQGFIAKTEKFGAAAKVCGAGSIAGDNAGVVMVMTDEIDQLTMLCKEFKYEMLPVQGEARGVHVV